jgi:hypothetical protein
VIKGTRRPDGTYRKDIIRKAGYVPEGEQPKYHDKVRGAPRRTRARPALDALIAIVRSCARDASPRARSGRRQTRAWWEVASPKLRAR